MANTSMRRWNASASRTSLRAIFAPASSKKKNAPTRTRTITRRVDCLRSVVVVLSAATARPADLVVADPPYEVPNAEVEAVLAALTDNGWTAPGTVVVVERPAGVSELVWPPHWSVGKARRYGDTRIELAQRV